MIERKIRTKGDRMRDKTRARIKALISGVDDNDREAVVEDATHLSTTMVCGIKNHQDAVDIAKKRLAAASGNLPPHLQLFPGSRLMEPDE